jgi:hypothetical protein
VLDHSLHPQVRLLDGDFYAGDPHPVSDWLRARAPVYRDEAAGVWGVTLEPRIRAIVGELIDRVAPRGGCDFVRDLAAPLPLIVIGDMLGVEPEDRDDLLRWSDDLITGTSSSSPPVAAAAAMELRGATTA